MIQYEQQMQTNQTATGNGQVLSAMRRGAPVVYVIGAGVIASGVVKIEEAHTADYAGAWHEHASIDAAELTGGEVRAVHLVEGVYGHIRARISTTIAGGGNISAIGRMTE